MNAQSKIVENYYRLVKKCFTITDIKVHGGNNRQFDILAYQPEGKKYYHIEVGVTHRQNWCPNLNELKDKFCQNFLVNLRTNGLIIKKPILQKGNIILSRLTKLDTKTIMKYLQVFVREGIVVKVKQKNKYPYYEANRLSTNYRMIKSTKMMQKLALSGLVVFLEKELKPKAIVLFGSVQKGTYHKKSDIDIFIQGKETNIDISKYQKRLNHEIQLFFEDNLDNLTKGLRNNIISGNTLSGCLSL